MSTTTENITPAAARKRLTALRRHRETRISHGPCTRCGGAGGRESWPGFTCFRCGGDRPQTFEVIKRRVYTDSFLAERDAFLQGIVDAAAEAGQMAKAGVWQAQQRELAHEAAVKEDAEREARNRTPYLGEVGAKVTGLGEVLLAIVVDSHFGSQMLIVLRDAATGALLKTFTSSSAAWDVEAGMQLEMTGTVKAHERYRDEKHTVLSRVKMVASEAVSAA
jgi:hypothetical protein